MAAPAGVMAGTIAVSLAISYGTLIFRGDLESSAPIGVGLALVGGLIVGLVVAVTSGFDANVAGTQDGPAVVIGLAAAAIGTRVTTDSAEDTVLAFVIVTTASMGLFLFALGHLRIGGLVRFLPYPVIGGFLGGTGVILVQSTFDVVLQGRPIEDLFGGDVAVRWIPATALGVILIVVFRRRASPQIVMPGLIVGGSIMFHLSIAVAGIGRDEALDRGWLLGPFPDRSLWPGAAATSLGGADWGAIAGQATSVAAILLVGAVSVLLHTTGLENELNVDVDVDRELRSVGAANLIASVAGGLPGYMYLADSAMVARVVRPNRMVALVSASVVGLALVVGAGLLSLIPVAVSAGILFFIGGSFVVEWLYDARRRLSHPDYLLVLIIMASIAGLGFLSGLAIGIAIAMALFVLRYSRTDVVRHHFDGHRRRSNVARTRAQQAMLDEHGAEIAILELQGFVFFGTADRVLSAVRQRTSGDTPLRDVVLDFRRVTGLDSSAAVSFAKIARLGRAEGFTLSLTGLDEAMVDRLTGEVEIDDGSVFAIAPDLDRGLEAAEDRLLAAWTAEADEDVDVSLDALVAVLGHGSALERYLAELPAIDVSSGTRLLIRGRQSPGLYFLEDGGLSIEVDGTGEDTQTRHRSVGPGTLVGEMSWYLDGYCTATVTANGPCRVRKIDPRLLDDRDPDHRAVLSDLHLFTARTLAERLSHANEVIDHLLR